MLYIADEVFLTGTAAEITPVRSVDKIVVGKGVARAGDGGAAEGVLRRDRVPGPRRVRLAHVRAREGAAGGAGGAPAKRRIGAAER